MHFLIRETLSFNLMYVAACYPVGTTISKTSPLFTALLQHYIVHNFHQNLHRTITFNSVALKIHRQDIKNILFYFTNQIIFRVGG